ncbi:MAG: CSLREA domain-containing protein, partial [Oscillochloris sp.]|nr:CSLREA domain-containing protein [Oscillochloris sp.]
MMRSGTTDGHGVRRWSAVQLFLMICVALAPLLLMTPQAVQAATFTVNSSADPGDGTCDGTECTLREAITAANATAGADTITFAIPGAGPHEIVLAGGLPAVSETLTIDGLTQAGASCATWPPTLLIELNGTNVVADDVLDFGFSAAGSTVRGLVINRAFNAIQLANSSNNVIECNFLGTSVDGNTALGNALAGVYIQQDSNNNRIGGPNASQRNLIAGNGDEQISINNFGSTPDNNLIENNYIGTNAAGSAGLGGGVFGGIYLFGNVDTTIRNNLIAGNTSNGISVTGDATRNSTGTLIQGNRIGTAIGGTSAVANAGGIALGAFG